MKADPFKPSVPVLVALGSIAVHAEEAMSNDGHQFDVAAIKTCLVAPGVKEWLAQMSKLAMLPVKRKP